MWERRMSKCAQVTHDGGVSQGTSAGTSVPEASGGDIVEESGAKDTVVLSVISAGSQGGLRRLGS